MQLTKVFYLKRPPHSLQKTEFCYDSVRQPNASFHLVDELSNSIIFPVEAIRDKIFCLKQNIFYLERPPRSPQKTKFCYDSVRQPGAG